MTPRGSSRARAERVFRALLRLLPLDFRNEHGREMEQVFRAQRGDAGDGTPLTVARFWLDTAQDVLRTAPTEHLAILKQDTTYAVRALRRAPAFSLAAILTLAIGIGATTALFTILNAFLFRPLPVERPGELASVATLDRHIELPHGLSLRDLEDYRSHNAAFSDLVGCMPLRAALNSGGGAEPIAVEAVTGNYFSVLGVPPALGRVIGSAEGRAQGDAPVLVLTYDFWRRRFAGDASVVGWVVRLNGRPFTIVGVAAAGFHSTEALLDVSAFVPVSMVAALSGSEAAHPSFFEDRDRHNLRVLGRLKPGVSIAQARAAMAVKARALAQQYPDTNAGVSLFIVPETSARPEPATGPWFRMAAGAFTLLAMLLLTITSANIANMLLARAATRGREVAIRTAIGARRGRIVRQLLTEGVVLALAGGVVAIPVAAVLVEWFGRGAGAFSGIPLRVDLGFDWRVLTAALIVACASGIVAGLAPALYVFRADVHTLLRTGGRAPAAAVDRGLFRRALLVSQIAVSLVLLVTGGLFVKSLDRVRHLDLGFKPDRLLIADAEPGLSGYGDAARLAFYRRAEARVATLPRVTSVAWTSWAPFSSESEDVKLFVDGAAPRRPGDVPMSFSVRVGPRYFATAGVPLVAGRAFTDADDSTHAPVMIVNQTFARQTWPDQNPIGRRVRFSPDGPRVEVVGVARDGKYYFVWEEPRPMVFRPIAQDVPVSATLVAQTGGPPADLLESVRRALHDVDPEVPVITVQTMASHLEFGNAFIIFRMGAALSSLFGVTGLLLASIGLYGVIAYHVTQRSHEIGVRLALGAQPSAIVASVLGRGARFATAGAVVGIALAAAVGRFVRPLLLGVSPFDAATYASVTLVLVAVALAASLVPARRAVSVDPLESLRVD